MKKFKEFFVNSFFCYLAIELVEETIEELLAVGISAIFIKGISTLCVVSITQFVKVLIKKFVKTITYKEGNDKVNKIKQFFTWIFCNKKTIVGTISAGVATLSSTEVIDVSTLPELLIGGFNLTPVLYYGVLAVLTIVGVFGKGAESIKQYHDRKEVENAIKQEKAILKEAKKEIANEKKLANQTQAEQEKAQTKADAEAKAKAEKEKAEQEHRAKLEQVKARLKEEEALKNEDKKV